MTAENSRPIDPRVVDDMKALARSLDEILNGEDRKGLPGRGKVGFALLTFPFDEEATVNYISNANREDMIVALKAFVARAEGQPMTAGRA